MNSSSNTTFFTVNRTNVKKIDPKRATVVISVEEFEDLMSYKRICKDLFKEFGDDLLE